ncbi:hypothetical protein OH799_06690 [Nocardia sp. NBC_00881]|uniref:hypothetical protein n=1 Tax=Nocardia sp. NBC_00881 TaxID=2975995 RepID=UPI003870AFC3|nr:hypothetical protein OH799_06690 [Nocardia sp. NBC_00881]
MSKAAGLPVGAFTGHTAQRIGRGALGGTRPLLLVVISGRDATYRGWMLQSMSQRYRLLLLSARPAEWELPYIVGQNFLEILDGVKAAVAAAERLKEHGPIAGVVCYDEMRIVPAARLAERLGLPTATSAAARITGTPLRRPPASFVKGRAALGYALAADVTTCQHALTELADAVEITGAPIPAAVDPRPSRARR